MNDLLKSPFLAVITFFILLFLYSTFGPKIPFSLVTQEKGEPFMVTETGNATAVPDIAKVYLGIEENGDSLKTVQENVNKKSKALVGELKKLGIEEKNIKTNSYNVYPEYNYDQQPPQIRGYRVSINYQVTIENFDKVNEVLVKATEVGANNIGNISFELKDETKEKALNEAREEASNKAKEKAKSLAKISGISLGRIINISESTGAEDIRPMYTAKAVSLTSLESTKPEITPEETEISITLSISWEIK